MSQSRSDDLSRRGRGWSSYPGNRGRYQRPNMVRYLVGANRARVGWTAATSFSPILEWRAGWYGHHYKLLSGKLGPIDLQRSRSKGRAPVPQWIEPSRLLYLLEDADRRGQRLRRADRLR